MRICVDFQGIGMDFDNCRAETSGKTLKLFMRIPRKFIDPNRVDGELVNVQNDRDTIVSAQRETANMIYRQYGNDGLPIIKFVVVENHWFVRVTSNLLLHMVMSIVLMMCVQLLLTCVQMARELNAGAIL